MLSRGPRAQSRGGKGMDAAVSETSIIERLRARAQDGGRPSLWPGMLREAADEIERLQDALREIVQWSEAYPLDIFPEPDFKKARELLEAGGITLDAVSASCMRHVVEGVGKIARHSLEKME